MSRSWLWRPVEASAHGVFIGNVARKQRKKCRHPRRHVLLPANEVITNYLIELIELSPAASSLISFPSFPRDVAGNIDTGRFQVSTDIYHENRIVNQLN